MHHSTVFHKTRKILKTSILHQMYQIVLDAMGLQVKNYHFSIAYCKSIEVNFFIQQNKRNLV